MGEEVVEVVETAVSSLIQLACECGVPLDHVPKTQFEVSYLSGCIQWATFCLTLVVGFVNNLTKSVIGGIR